MSIYRCIATDINIDINTYIDINVDMSRFDISIYGNCEPLKFLKIDLQSTGRSPIDAPNLRKPSV